MIIIKISLGVLMHMYMFMYQKFCLSMIISLGNYVFIIVFHCHVL